MSFPDAIKEVMTGKKVTRMEWDNRNIYGVLMDGQLKILLEDKKYHPWIISDGDLMANDWIIVEPN